MEALDFVALSLGAAYVVYVGVESELLSKVRPMLGKIPFIGRIFSCAYCMSFWAGVFMLVVWQFYPPFVYACAIASTGLLLTLVRWRISP